MSYAPSAVTQPVSRAGRLEPGGLLVQARAVEVRVDPAVGRAVELDRGMDRARVVAHAGLARVAVRVGRHRRALTRAQPFGVGAQPLARRGTRGARVDLRDVRLRHRAAHRHRAHRHDRSDRSTATTVAPRRRRARRARPRTGRRRRYRREPSPTGNRCRRAARRDTRSVAARCRDRTRSRRRTAASNTRCSPGRCTARRPPRASRSTG